MTRHTNPPVVERSILAYNPGETAIVLDSTHLSAADADNSAGQLTYTITSMADDGKLQVLGDHDNNPATADTWRDITATFNTFTQADINAGRVRYVPTNPESTADTSFTFTVADGTTSVSGTLNIDVREVLTITRKGWDEAHDVLDTRSGGGEAFDATDVGEWRQNILTGIGNDQIIGGQGNDYIYLAGLTNQFEGGADEVIYRFSSGSSWEGYDGSDFIQGFRPGEDKFVFRTDSSGVPGVTNLEQFLTAARGADGQGGTSDDLLVVSPHYSVEDGTIFIAGFVFHFRGTGDYSEKVTLYFERDSRLSDAEFLSLIGGSQNLLPAHTAFPDVSAIQGSVIRDLTILSEIFGQDSLVFEATADPTLRITAPEFDPRLPTLKIAENQDGSSTPIVIGRPITATDPAGHSVTYSLLGTSAGFEIDSVTGQIRYTGSGLDYELFPAYDRSIKLKVVATSSGGQVEQLVRVYVTNVDEPSISDTNPPVNNRRRGGMGDDTLYGGAGNDSIRGGMGDDTLYGGEGHDKLHGGMGRDYLYGGDGNDYLNGGYRNDYLNGGRGRDILTGGWYGNNIFVLGITNTQTSDLDIVLDFRTSAFSAGRLTNADKIEVATATGTETTLEALMSAANIRWTQDSDYSELGLPPYKTPSYNANDPNIDDTVIYHTRGTADTSDDIILMVLQDYNTELTFADFKVVKAPTTPVNQAPTFNPVPTDLTIAENQDGTSTTINIGSPITATDPDGDTITYSLSGAPAGFGIDSATGQIHYCGSGVDYETTPTITFTVIASSTSGGVKQTARQDVTISVTDVAEAFAFTTIPTDLTIAENQDGSSSPVNIGSPVTATDPDGDTITYSLSGAPAGFEIDSATGQIRYTGPGFNYETLTAQERSISFTVVATSTQGGAEQIVRQDVTIAVTDVAEAFAFTTIPTDLTIAENQDGSSSPINIGSQFVATHPTGAPVTYIIAGIHTGWEIDETTGEKQIRFISSGWEIDETTGQIRYTGSGLDFETTPTITLTVFATVTRDGIGHTIAKTVTISVTDIDEAPTFNPLPTDLTIAENQDGTSTTINIGSPVTASHSDSQATITYSLSGAPAGFGIDSATGQIHYCGAGLDYETSSTIRFTVIATSTSGGVTQTASQTVTITVTDVDEAPEFDPLPTDLTIAENQDGTSTAIDIGSPVTATDPDGDTITYSLSGAPAGFAIDSTTGQIRYTGSGFNYETLTAQERSISFTIVATSTSGGVTQTASQTVTITVADVDEAPEFDPLPTDLTIAENQDGTSTIINIGSPVTATDPDGDTITYSLSGAPAGFGIDSATGQIHYCGSGLDYETTPTITLTVIASSTQGGVTQEARQDVTITVTDVNERPYLSLPASASLTNTGADDTFTDITGQFAATDPDTNDALTYNVRGGVADTSEVGFTHSAQGTYGKLYYNSATGQYKYVANAAAINALTADAAEGFLISVDDGSLSSNTRPFSININYDAPPAFNPLPSDLTITENQDGTSATINIGSPITATDPDGDTITYSLSGAPAGFGIDSATGQIHYCGSGVDYETTPTITFTVIASSTQGGRTQEARQTVTISVTDVDEPSFVGRSTLAYNPGQTAIVLDSTHLFTTDADSRAEQLTYTITSLSSTGKLQVLGDHDNDPDTADTWKDITATFNTFTQADIYAGKVRYIPTNPDSTTDTSFSFTVTDGTAGSTPTSGTLNIDVREVYTIPESGSNAQLPVTAQIINGGDGMDGIRTGGGNDQIIGGLGLIDWIFLSWTGYSAGGADEVVYRFSGGSSWGAYSGLDVLDGFKRGEDKLVLTTGVSEIDANIRNINDLLIAARGADGQSLTEDDQMFVTPIQVDEGGTFFITGLKFFFRETGWHNVRETGTQDFSSTDSSWDNFGITIYFDTRLTLTEFSRLIATSDGSQNVEYSATLNSYAIRDLTVLPKLLGRDSLEFRVSEDIELRTVDPVFDPLPTDLTITENQDGTRTTINVGSPITATDPGEYPITYSLLGAPTGFGIDSATGQIHYCGSGLDYETTPTITFKVVAVSSGGRTEQTVTIAVTDVDETLPTARLIEDSLVFGTAEGQVELPAATGSLSVQRGSVNIPLASDGTYTGIYGKLRVNQDGTWEYIVDNDDADTNGLNSGNVGKEVFTLTYTDSAGQTLTHTLTFDIEGRTDHSTATTNAFSQRWARDDLAVHAILSGRANTIVTGTGNDIVLHTHNKHWENFKYPTFTYVATYTYVTSVGDGNDEVHGGAGMDFIHGGRGNDYLFGGGSNDSIFGNDDNDFLYGGKGNDYLNGGYGNDYLYGGTGSDRLSGGYGNDYLYGGEGHDRLQGDWGDDFLYGDEGNDRLYGGRGNDRLTGGEGNDRLYGSRGNDYLQGSEGSDHLYGGTGDDTLYGNEGNDVLFGNMENDKLYGGDGDDELYGYYGNDYLYGGTGRDILSGGWGNDIFALGVTNTRISDLDIVIDFVRGNNKIEVATQSGTETTLKALKSAANIRWTQNSDYSTLSGIAPHPTNGRTHDTIIYHTRGTADESDDIALMVLEDYNTELTFADFKVVRADPPPAPAEFAFNAIPTDLTIAENEEGYRTAVNIGSPITATDPAGNAITYSLLDAPTGFEIDSATGQIRYTGTGLNYEATPTLTLTIGASSASGERIAEDVTITVTDVAERLTFGALPTDLTIAENQDGSDTAIDIGSPLSVINLDNIPITFSIVGSLGWHFGIGDSGEWFGSPESADFEIDRLTGQIRYTGTGLDFETTPTITLLFLAGNEDAGGWTRQTVTITVTDVDETFTFNPVPSDLTLAENQDGSAGTAIDIGSPITATHTDSTGSTITYTLSGAPAGFEIDSATGQIRYTGAGFNYETLSEAQRSITFTITATSSASGRADQTITQQVTITITDVNERPYLSFPQTATLTNTPATDTFTDITGRFDATDPDSNTLTYIVRGGVADTSEEGFTHSATGTYGKLYYNSGTGAYKYVANAAAINALTSDTADGFLVTASDGSLRSNTRPFAVNIEYNEAPAFNPLPTDLTLAENQDGTSTSTAIDIGSPVTATDADTQGAITYTLSNPPTGFEIDPVSGQIRYTGAGFDYEALTQEERSITLTVVATSADGGQTTQDVTITITNVDEPLVVERSTLAYNPGRTFIVLDSTHLSAADEDIGDRANQFTYTITSLSANGKLQVLGDHDNDPDTADTWKDITATFNTFTQADINAGRVRYVPTDPDSTTDTSFSFTVTNGADGTSPLSGTLNIDVREVETIANPDSNNVVDLSAQIVARIIDTQGEVDIIGTGTGNDQIIPGLGDDFVWLAGPAGQSEGGADEVIYRFTGGAQWASYDGTDTIQGFRRGEDKIVFTTTASQTNARDLNAFLIAARGADGQGLTADDQLIVKPLYTIEGGISYVSGLGFYFADTGTYNKGVKLYFETPLTMAEFLSLVRISDNNPNFVSEVSGTAEQAGIVDLTILPNLLGQHSIEFRISNPEFNPVPTDLTIAENQDGSAGTAIAIGSPITATYLEGYRITYSLSGAPEGFTIDPRTGQILYTGSAFNYEALSEEQRSITFTVVATANGGRTEQEVTISITDVDETVRFNPVPSDLTIAENQDGTETAIDVGSPITATHLAGRDIGYYLVGYIVDGESGNIVWRAPAELADFRIDIATGQISYVGSGLDFETTPTITLSVMAHYNSLNKWVKAGEVGWSDRVFVTITIEDVNERPYLSAPAVASITNTGATDTFTDITGQFAASDPDGDTLTYIVRGGVADTSEEGFTHSAAGRYGKLYFNSGTGAYKYVANAAAINALTSDTADGFLVSVDDGSLHSSSRLFTVNIDYNAPPAFNPVPSDLTLDENQDGSGTAIDIGSPITATDADTQGAIRYSLSGAPAGFEIDPITGQIRYTGAGFNYEALTQAQRSITFTVIATSADGGRSTQQVTITIEDVDEAATAFTLSHTSSSANPGLSTYRKLADIDISDDALGVNTIHLAGPNSDYFKIVQEADGSWALYLKADKTLAQATVYTVTLTFTTTGIGETPASLEYSLNIASVTGGEQAQVIEDSYRFDTASGQIELQTPTDMTYRLSVQAGGGAQTSIGNVDTHIAGTYGTLIVNQDGRWVYRLDNSDEDTNALDSGDRGREVFTFTYTDEAGQTLTRTLTITIEGRTDHIVVGRFDQSSTDEHLAIHAGDEQRIDTGAGDDVIIRTHSSSSKVHTYAGDGNDEIYGGKSENIIFGGGGHDYIYGDAFNDDLYGGGDNDEIYGNGGNDILVGEGGNDYLNGGAGRDVLSGGTGNDVFVLGLTNTRSDDLDFVSDFGRGDNKIEVATATGAETTLKALMSSANIRWTQDSDYRSVPGAVVLGNTNDRNIHDTIIYHTRGTEDTSDDIVLMVLEDYTTALTFADFEVVRALSVNERPIFNSIPTDLTIAENQDGSGTAIDIGSPVTANVPQGQSITYSLSNAPAGFEIDSATGQIRYTGSGLDYEAPNGQSIALLVIATSENGHTEQVVRVSVTDINDAPILSASSLAYNQGQQAIVLTRNHLLTTDIDRADDASQLTYTITGLSSVGKLQFLGDHDDNPATPETWADIDLQDHFTQADINAGRVRYVPINPQMKTGTSFAFRVADGGENGVGPVSGTLNVNVRRVVAVENPEGANVINLDAEGQAGAKSVNAGNGQDRIMTGAGDDQIDGGRGNDDIHLGGRPASQANGESGAGGQAGSASQTGGADEVVYRFSVSERGDWVAYDGADRITGFKRGEDKIVFQIDASQLAGVTSLEQFLMAARGPDGLILTKDDQFTVRPRFEYDDDGTGFISGIAFLFRDAGNYGNGKLAIGSLVIEFAERLTVDAFLSLVETDAGDRNIGTVLAIEDLTVLPTLLGENSIEFRLIHNPEIITGFTKGDKIEIDTETGAETDIEALMQAANIRWTQDSDYSSIPGITPASTNDENIDDTVIYDTRGTADTADDIVLTVLEDYDTALTIIDFDII